MERPRRILHLCSMEAEPGLGDLLGALDLERYPSRLVVPRAGELSERAESLGIPVSFVALPRFAQFYRLWSVGEQLQDLVKAEALELLHAHTPLALTCALLARTRRPVVWHLHQAPPLFFSMNLARKSDVVIASSQTMASLFPRRWLEAGRVQVHPRGLPGAWFQARKEPHSLPRVGCIGSLAWADKIEVSAQFLAIQELCPSTHLDLLVLPRPTGPHLIQALALGVPTVAVDSPVAREFLVDGVTGLLVPRHGLGAAVERLLADAGLASELSRRARHQARQRFGAEAWARRVEGVYAGLLFG